MKPDFPLVGLISFHWSVQGKELQKLEIFLYLFHSKIINIIFWYFGIHKINFEFLTWNAKPKAICALGFRLKNNKGKCLPVMHSLKYSMWNMVRTAKKKTNKKCEMYLLPKGNIHLLFYLLFFVLSEAGLLLWNRGWYILAMSMS